MMIAMTASPSPSFPPYFWATTIGVILICLLVGGGAALALSREVNPLVRLVGFVIVAVFVTIVVTITLNHS